VRRAGNRPGRAANLRRYRWRWIRRRRGHAPQLWQRLQRDTRRAVKREVHGSPWLSGRVPARRPSILSRPACYFHEPAAATAAAHHAGSVGLPRLRRRVCGHQRRWDARLHRPAHADTAAGRHGRWRVQRPRPSRGVARRRSRRVRLRPNEGVGRCPLRALGRRSARRMARRALPDCHPGIGHKTLGLLRLRCAPRYLLSRRHR
jgi:hypothetical protein